ncbi:MAG TPA: hypothetical protein VG820_11585 [Fimbriimonadaceae bacterium]|nr:hypothetical protein [Fimbriimonadaceae bacterium]
MVIVLLLAVVAFGFASSSSEIVEGKIAAVTNRGYVLQAGSRSIEVVASRKTRFWQNRAAADPSAFRDGDLVAARILKSKSGIRLEEIADRESWTWLEDIRAHSQFGTVVVVGPKSLLVQFGDGSRFKYEATDRTKVSLRGRPGMALADLKPGDKVYAKGRGLVSGETFLVEVADRPLPDSEKRPKPARKAPEAREGTVGGKIEGCWPQYRMFDLTQGDKVVHISYNRQTKFTLDGRPTSAISLRSQLHAVVFYRTDKFGKILASRVELSTHLERMVRTGVGKRASASSEELFP